MTRRSRVAATHRPGRSTDLDTPADELEGSAVLPTGDAVLLNISARQNVWRASASRS